MGEGFRELQAKNTPRLGYYCSTDVSLLLGLSSTVHPAEDGRHVKILEVQLDRGIALRSVPIGEGWLDRHGRAPTNLKRRPIGCRLIVPFSRRRPFHGIGGPARLDSEGFGRYLQKACCEANEIGIKPGERILDS